MRRFSLLPEPSAAPAAPRPAVSSTSPHCGLAGETSPGFGLIFLSSDPDRFCLSGVRIRIDFAGLGSDSDRFLRARFGFGSVSPGQVRIRIGFRTAKPGSVRFRKCPHMSLPSLSHPFRACIHGHYTATHPTCMYLSIPLDLHTHGIAHPMLSHMPVHHTLRPIIQHHLHAPIAA